MFEQHRILDSMVVHTDRTHIFYPGVLLILDLYTNYMMPVGKGCCEGRMQTNLTNRHKKCRDDVHL